MSTNRIHRILFLCTGNACRSQMAEGWTRHLLHDEFEAWSAGVAPQDVDPRAVEVMCEVGVDIGDQRSKHVDTLLDVPFDLVATVCDNAAEACPLFARPVRKVHHGFQDPPKLAETARSEDEALAHYRRVRDEIRDFVETLPQLFQD